MDRALAFLEFFSGGGMARLALGPEFRCIFANDHDRQKTAAYRDNFGGHHLIERDIAALTTGDIPRADLAWASSPCQDLSLAGNRAGLRTARSGALWQFWSLMRDLEGVGRAPGAIVIENVPGLLTSSGGRDFSEIVTAFADIGYRSGVLELDAADFVPQSRRRIFMVCTRRSPPQALLATETGYGSSDSSHRALATLPAHIRSSCVKWHLPKPPSRRLRLVDCLDRDVPASAWRSDAACTALLSQMAPLHITRVEAAKRRGSMQVGAVYRRVRNGTSQAEVRYDGLAGCIRTLKGGSSRQLLLISENGGIRLRGLTGREAGRLMGLPEEYKLPPTLTAATNLAGDGVCVPLVRWLAKHLLVPLCHGNETKDFAKTVLKTGS
ncbi:MAG: DNA cytosine methyltransferase [Pseudomonadota bacterium]